MDALMGDEVNTDLQNARTCKFTCSVDSKYVVNMQTMFENRQAAHAQEAFGMCVDKEHTPSQSNTQNCSGTRTISLNHSFINQNTASHTDFNMRFKNLFHNILP